MRRGLILGFVLAGLWGMAPASFAQNPQVAVSVYNYAQVPADIVTRGEKRASQIFSRAGFGVIWLNCVPGGEVRCGNMGGARLLILRIVPRSPRTHGDMVLGDALLASDGTGQYGDVFWKKVQEVLETTSVDPEAILGSVMAHEIGHLLLGSKAHALDGIMEARWEAAEFRRINLGTLGFMPDQGRRIRERIAGSSALLVSGRELGRPAH
jgi:hypothetical protein